MSHNAVANIPSTLYQALEKATKKFPLRKTLHLEPLSMQKKLDGLVPSFKSPGEIPDSNVNYDKIKLLFQTSFIAPFEDRLTCVLEKLHRALKNGIPLRDLNHIIDILNLLKSHIQSNESGLLVSCPKFIGLFSYPILLPIDYTNASQLESQIKEIMDGLAFLTTFDNPIANDAIVKVNFSTISYTNAIEI